MAFICLCISLRAYDHRPEAQAVAIGGSSYSQIQERSHLGLLNRTGLSLRMMGTLMSKTILVAEDDANDQFFIQRELNKLAFAVEVRFVDDGEQTIAYLSALDKPDCQFPKPHVMFLDLKMPRLNGFEVLE